MALYNKKLCVKKPNGVIQKANLYTDKTDVGNNYLTFKDNGNTVYSILDVNGDVDCKVNKNGNVFSVKGSKQNKPFISPSDNSIQCLSEYSYNTQKIALDYLFAPTGIVNGKYLQTNLNISDPYAPFVESPIYKRTDPIRKYLVAGACLFFKTVFYQEQQEFGFLVTNATNIEYPHPPDDLKISSNYFAVILFPFSCLPEVLNKGLTVKQRFLTETGIKSNPIWGALLQEFHFMYNDIFVNKVTSLNIDSYAKLLQNSDEILKNLRILYRYPKYKNVYDGIPITPDYYEDKNNISLPVDEKDGYYDITKFAKIYNFNKMKPNDIIPIFTKYIEPIMSKNSPFNSKTYTYI